MGLPKITFPVLTLMFLVVIGGPAAILIFSREMPWLAIPLCVVLLLLGRYAATPGLRRLFTAVLLVTAIGTAISSILLAAARQDALAEPRQIWHVLVVIGILASSYCIGYFVVWYAFRLLSSFSIDFLCGLDEYIQKDTPEVRGFLINQYLGIGQAYQIVEDGKVVTTKPAGVLTALGGKGLLLIKPANAVVTEWGGDIRRVLGPGITWTERFERVKQVVPLNPQRVEFDVSAQTCEGIQLQVKGFFYCQIKPLSRNAAVPSVDQNGSLSPVKQGHKNHRNDKPAQFTEDSAKEIALALNLPQPKAVPINRVAVIQATYCSSESGWRRCTLDAVTAAVVETINRKSLQDLYALDQNPSRAAMLVTLARAAHRRANECTCDFGFWVTDLRITLLEAPHEVSERVLKPIAAAADAEALGARAEAQVTATQLLESVRSEVRTGEIGRVINLLEEYQGRIPPDQLMRAIGIAERLTGAIARQTPEDGLRLIQSVEDTIGRLLDH